MIAKSLGRRVALVPFVAVALLLTSCATSTPYQPKSAGQSVSGGYTETRLSQNRFRVSFEGNTLTSRERVEGYMLYRAAELTIQNGYDWFRVDDRQVDHDQHTYYEPSYRPWYGYGYWRPSWRYYRPNYGWHSWYPYGGDPFWAEDIDARTVEKFEARAEINMARGSVPAEERVFEARKVINDIGPMIERPKLDH